MRLRQIILLSDVKYYLFEILNLKWTKNGEEPNMARKRMEQTSRDFFYNLSASRVKETKRVSQVCVLIRKDPGKNDFYSNFGRNIDD